MTTGAEHPRTLREEEIDVVDVLHDCVGEAHVDRSVLDRQPVPLDEVELVDPRVRGRLGIDVGADDALALPLSLWRSRLHGTGSSAAAPRPQPRSRTTEDGRSKLFMRA